MDKEDNQEKVSVVIPCFNEGKTIRGVILSAEGTPWVNEIIVVNDGSTDETDKEVSKTNATLINLPENKGKAEAMEKGVAYARNNLVLFIDGDILNLDHEIMSRLVEPVMSGHYDLYVGIHSKKVWFLNKLLRFIPILSGERCLKKEVWESIPPEFKKGFQIETAMNYFAKRSGRKMGFEVLPRIKRVKKEIKYGFFVGFWRRIEMYCEVLLASVKLYVFRDLRFWFLKTKDSNGQV